MAALFETDKRKLPTRIAEAERALRRTARDLSEIPGDKVEEAEAVDDALYALRALRHCLEFNTMDPGRLRRNPDNPGEWHRGRL